MKKRWAPWKVALLVFGIVLAVGIVYGVFGFDPADRFYDARIDKYGEGLAQLTLASAVIAYVVQWRRRKT